MPEAPNSRIAFLRDRVGAAQSARDYKTFAVPFRQHQIDLVKIQVPIWFPLYNLQSGRTHRAQTEWIERHGLPADFFTDPEDEGAQNAQHQILVAMINEEGLAEDLDEKDQLNPIVLTYDGVIIDGNRRTAALRAQGDVENLVAVVLPMDATVSEVYETELELQMARETKAAYNWVDEAIHVSYGIRKLYLQAGTDYPQAVRSIAKRMNRPDREVEEILGRLSLVDLYLEWLGEPGKYHRVGTDGRSEAAQAFTELYQRESRPNFRSLPELQQRAIRLACFSVIRQDGGYMDIRRVADAIRQRPTDMVSRVRDELSPALAEKLDEPVSHPSDDTNSGAEDLLSQLAQAEGESLPAAGAQLLNIVDNPEIAPEVVPAITQVAQDLYEEERDSQRHLEPFRQVERALRTLRAVELTTRTQRLGDVAESLEQIIAETDRLAQTIDQLRSDLE
jgi:hypothetical protein